MAPLLQIAPGLAIAESELDFVFLAASGPGGQNVNKVASAVQLRFDAGRSPALNLALRRRLARLAGRRMTKAGILVIKAGRFRSQEQNRRDAVDRLLALLRAAARPPPARRRTRPPRAVAERRLAAKRLTAERKTTRRPPEG